MNRAMFARIIVYISHKEIHPDAVSRKSIENLAILPSCNENGSKLASNGAFSLRACSLLGSRASGRSLVASPLTFTVPSFARETPKESLLSSYDAFKSYNIHRFSLSSVIVWVSVVL